MSQLPFTGQDILDALMRAAFKPGSESYITTDYDGRSQVQSQPTPALIEPLVQLIKQFMVDDAEFQAKLRDAVLERIPEMAEAIVAKVSGTNSAFGIAMLQRGYGDKRDTYALAEWLQSPLGAAMAEALRPALIEHFNGEDGKPNFANASIDVNVTVKP